MSKRKPLISSIIDDRRRGGDQPAPPKGETSYDTTPSDVVSSDVRLLKEISLQVEREKIFGSFDASRPGEHVPCPIAPKDDVRAKKRPAPKYNKALKEAERAALQKPLTPNRYRQLMKEHLEILPLVRKKLDKKATR